MRELGGLHRFMGWDGPILTDSGGFQVFSLAKLRKMGEEGVEFRSHVDGSLRILSPGGASRSSTRSASTSSIRSTSASRYPATREADRALARAHPAVARGARWRRTARPAAPGRCSASCRAAAFPELRRRAVAETVALGFDGYAIGGMAVGEPKAVMYDIAALAAARLPADRPRYLMGVGKPRTWWRRGARRGHVRLRPADAQRAQRPGLHAGRAAHHQQARCARDPAPLEAECACQACRGFSRAYLRHLFMARELLAYRLLSLHNVTFSWGSMAAMRAAIVAGRFEAFRARFLGDMGRNRGVPSRGRRDCLSDHHNEKRPRLERGAVLSW